MNLLLVCIFLYVWMYELNYRFLLREEYFWLFVQGSIVVLCGVYFALQDLKNITEG